MKQFFNLIRLATMIVSITLFSCNKDKTIDSERNECNVSNPAEEIGWLKDAIDKVKQDEYSYYAMAHYKGETVFYYGSCNPLANFASHIQNCSGENLGNTNDLQDDLTDITIIWKHKNSKCNFQ